MSFICTRRYVALIMNKYKNDFSILVYINNNNYCCFLLVSVVAKLVTETTNFVLHPPQRSTVTSILLSECLMRKSGQMYKQSYVWGRYVCTKNRRFCNFYYTVDSVVEGSIKEEKDKKEKVEKKEVRKEENKEKEEMKEMEASKKKKRKSKKRRRRKGNRSI